MSNPPSKRRRESTATEKSTAPSTKRFVIVELLQVETDGIAHLKIPEEALFPDQVEALSDVEKHGKALSALFNPCGGNEGTDTTGVFGVLYHTLYPDCCPREYRPRLKKRRNERCEVFASRCGKKRLLGVGEVASLLAWFVIAGGV